MKRIQLLNIQKLIPHLAVCGIVLAKRYPSGFTMPVIMVIALITKEPEMNWREMLQANVYD